jgi:DNA topoisomerase-1
MELFKLPRDLGQTPDGEPVQANIGRFGPSIRYGAKYVSLKEDDPYTVELPRALELIEQKKIADANRIIRDFPEAGIQVLNGRYGPYITDKTRNAKSPKDRDPKSLTLEECRELLAQAPARRGRRGRPGAPAPAAAAQTAAIPTAEPGSTSTQSQPQSKLKKKSARKPRVKAHAPKRAHVPTPQKPTARRKSAAGSSR